MGRSWQFSHLNCVNDRHSETLLDIYDMEICDFEMKSELFRNVRYGVCFH